MFDILQLLGGVILSVGYIPQILKLIKTKSSNDFNINTFIFVFIGIAMIEAYAIDLAVNGSGIMYLITNTMSLIIQGIMVALILKFKTKERNEKHE